MSPSKNSSQRAADVHRTHLHYFISTIISSARHPVATRVFRRTSAATINPVPLQLSTPVKFVKRIGDRIAAGLADRGVSTIEDLLYHLPFRYEDRLHPKPLSLYNPGDMASLIGEVRGTTLLRTRSGPIFEMTVGIKPPDPNSEAALHGLLAPPPAFAPATRSLSPSAQDILETVK